MTTQPLPVAVACSLEGQELAERASWFDDLFRTALVDADMRNGSVHLWFDTRAGDRVAELVRLESRCCPFFRFHMEMSGDQLELSVGAPEDSAQLIEMIYASASKALLDPAS